MIMPAPYTVNLVSPDVLRGLASRNSGNEIQARAKKSTAAVSPADVPTESKKETAKEREMIEKKISAIAAKKKIERVVKLRSEISLKAGTIKQNAVSKSLSASRGGGTSFDDYYTKITKEIWEQWVYPDTGKKNMEAIISIKILKDGTAVVQKIEKSSGNQLFDRSALKALTKASPLPAPPYEMEIGVRFLP
jgi:colicin import membrane protein